LEESDSSSEDEKSEESDSSTDGDENYVPPDPSYEPPEPPQISPSKSMNYAVARSFPITEQKFQACFEDSVFMKNYSKVGTREPPLSEWLEGLYKIFPKSISFIDDIVKGSDGDDSRAVISIWTWSTDITKPINLSLMMDAYNTFDLKEIDVKYVKSELKKKKLNYKEVIKNSIKFIRRVNTVLIDIWTFENTEDRTVYRGVNAKLFPNVNVGDEFRIVNFCWTSVNKKVAEGFTDTPGSNEAKTLLTMTIPKYCYNAGKIKVYSFFQDEEETLIPPYTSCKLMSKDGNNMKLVIAQDNLNACFDKYSL
jgi:hypothetical protein